MTDRIRGAPDLVIEVLSPHPRVGMLNEHLAWFAEYGVKECWLADLPSRRLEVLAFQRGVVRDRVQFQGAQPIRSEVLPGFERSVTSILGW